MFCSKSESEASCAGTRDELKSYLRLEKIELHLRGFFSYPCVPLHFQHSLAKSVLILQL